MNIEQIYKDTDALLEGHFLLASGNHSSRYLQSAKVLEYPKKVAELTDVLAKMIHDSKVAVDTVCAPALGGVLAGYELARSLDVRSIFVEKRDGNMELRRGFTISHGEKIIICEDIITTGGSALKAAQTVEALGGKVVAFASLANRGFCRRIGGTNKPKPECKLPKDVPLFSLEDFTFEMYSPKICPMCKEGSVAIKPGSSS
ncbi:MAG: orotate phosphoribosyltransferase [Sulfurovum sp.]|nr:orotate phosphoribosyltransferase [Sulfurovum sp.]MCB4744729.1 orotate phosphoribosyltransferase [Sulfurovum sp.]MCB4746802.1 orotate phosphoribosyltransferase [Sulfurovum sp.]MCB4749523.1 orotate phosphoribosyltransferase [Sulfurovum sp.]MCB4750215.1 orotate phosphoribosyltransferase [Sulfurovum sp.]